MAEIINTNLDTTPLPPNNLVAQDPESAELAGYVRTKTFGRDVRESIARSIELNSTRSKSAEILASETVNVANDLTDRFNQQIGALTEDSEVIDARDGEVNLRAKLMTYEGAKRKTDDHVLLSDFGLDDAGVQACFDFAHQNKKGILVDGMAEINTPKVIGKEILWIKGKSLKDSGFLPKGDFGGQPILKATNYYTSPLKMSDLTINAYHMTDAVKNGLLVDAGNWGSCAEVSNVNFYYFNGYEAKLVDAYKCKFDSVLFQGTKISDKVVNTSDWTTWINNFDGTGVVITGANSFSNVNTFTNVTYLYLRQSVELDKARLTVFNECTFDQINLAFELRNNSEATLNSPWLEYVEKVVINSEVDKSTLTAINPYVKKSDIEQFKVFNARGLYLTPKGYLTNTSGVNEAIKAPIIDKGLNPALHQYFTWESGLDVAPMTYYKTVVIDKPGYSGEIIVDAINQRLNYVRCYFTANEYTGGKYLNEVPFKVMGRAYGAVFKATDKTLAGYVRLEPYTVENKSLVVLDFTPEAGVSYDFSFTAQKIIV